MTEACCTGKTSPDGKEWICTTCLKYIKRNSLPPQACANNLALPETPPELSNLTTLEERLLSQRYPFMKLLALPKGGKVELRVLLLMFLSRPNKFVMLYQKPQTKQDFSH